jgi:hypothetical protein
VGSVLRLVVRRLELEEVEVGKEVGVDEKVGVGEEVVEGVG